MKKSKLLIYTEAGKVIGFGHLTRCRAIARAFEFSGFDFKILLETRNFEANPEQKEVDFNWHTNFQKVNQPEDTIVIVDSYLASKECLTKISEHFPFVVMIDDYNRIEYPVDLIINPGEDMGEIDYSNQKAPVYRGKEFILLRDEVRQHAGQHKCFNTVPKRILITVGGSDVHNLLGPIAASIQSHFANSRVTTICPDPEQLNKFIEAYPHLDVLPRQDVKSIVQLFLNSDLVISACGQTLHELAALGTPFIGLLTGNDQLYNQAFYYSSGVLSEKIRYDQSDMINAIAHAATSLKYADKRKNISSLLSSLSEANGVENIRDLILLKSAN